MFVKLLLRLAGVVGGEDGAGRRAGSPPEQSCFGYPCLLRTQANEPDTGILLKNLLELP